jgi:hypothetical protein
MAAMIQTDNAHRHVLEDDASHIRRGTGYLRRVAVDLCVASRWMVGAWM